MELHFSDECGGISIHALLAESDHYDNYNLHCVEISIHALLAESDDWPPVRDIIQWISIHALLAESDEALIILTKQLNDFYPRSPCGERPPSITPAARRRNFYPRSPCGERLGLDGRFKL